MKRFPTLPLLLLPLRVLAGSRLDYAYMTRRYNYLQELPSCAFNCVVQFTSISFPSCESGSLDCLCTSQSESGFTLGEGAVKCLASDCPGASAYLLNAAYALCTDVRGAQPETHATLEASMVASATILLTPVAASTTKSGLVTSTRSPSFTRSVRHTGTSTHTATHSPSLSASSSDPITLDTSTFPTHQFPSQTRTSSSAATSSTSGNFNSSAASNGQPTPQTVLTKAQIAGIAVSGTVISAIAIGLLFCLFRSKRLGLRRRRDSDASFGEKGDYARQVKTPNLDSQPEPREDQLGVAPKAKQFLGIPANPAQKRWTLWRKAMKENPRENEIPQISNSDEAVIERSPASVQSYQTTSRLLPDKPQTQFRNVQWQPSPSRLRPDQYRMGPGDTRRSPKQPVRFANDVGLRVITPTPPPSHPSSSSGSWQEQNTSQSALQRQALRHQLSDPFIDKSGTHYVPPSSLRRASNKDLPKIVTPDAISYPIPQQSSYMQPWRNQQQQQQRQPTIPRVPAPYNPGIMASYVSPREVNPYEDHIPSKTKFDQRQHLQRSFEPSSDTFSKWRPLRRSSKSLRPLTHYTTGSDTSFEDDGDDTREDIAVSALSPVAESPARQRNNGVSSVYYPPVPGAVPSAKRLQVTPQRDRLGQSPQQTVSPIELPDSSPDPSKHTSPNFSRPQQQARQRIDYETAPPKWQVLSSPGLHGEQETWSSPISAVQQRERPTLRPAIVQVRSEQRGPWRGRNAPIGSQWHHEHARR